MSFIAITDRERKEMLDAIGVSSFEDLIQRVPKRLLYPKLNIPRPLSQLELTHQVKRLAAMNKKSSGSGLGGGAYDHFIPAPVWALATRGEFMTAYTPYQAEASQGTLQAIYEFQTMICELFQMEVANASMYDGASALAEACLMALRTQDEESVRDAIIYPRALHPHYLRTLQTYLRSFPAKLVEVSCPDGIIDLSDLKKKVNRKTAAVVVQNPNFFGCLEDGFEISKLAHERGALLIACVAEPISLGLIAPPGAYEADIAVGEGQSLGIPLCFGGPYLGLMACTSKLLRKLPGRICGMTKDGQGQRGFVLTLQAREQHIRREKATSNICTNEALCSLAATIYLSLLGPQGLKEVAELNFYAAHNMAKALDRQGFKLRFPAPFFNEFVAQSPRLLNRCGGLPLGRFYSELEDSFLVCMTENDAEFMDAR